MKKEYYNVEATQLIKKANVIQKFSTQTIELDKLPSQSADTIRSWLD